MEDLTQFSEAPLELLPFAVNLFITAVIASIIAKFYTTFGYGISNRSQFAKNFVVLAVTTMIVISVVKSSLALSLGLVGALSIVRFRAAIKEPEELSYLFLCIAVGLGMGANQVAVTVVGVGGVLSILAIMRWKKQTSPQEKPNLFLEVTFQNNEHTLTTVSNILRASTIDASLIRYEKNKDGSQMMFSAAFENVDDIDEFRQKIDEIGNVSLTLYDNRA